MYFSNTVLPFLLAPPLSQKIRKIDIFVHYRAHQAINSFDLGNIFPVAPPSGQT